MQKGVCGREYGHLLGCWPLPVASTSSMHWNEAGESSLMPCHADDWVMCLSNPARSLTTQFNRAGHSHEQVRRRADAEQGLFQDISQGGNEADRMFTELL